MDGVDPDTLLEWLQTGAGDERDLQLMALEQLCMLLLMSDNIDRCFESCPPRSFLPALGRIFLDETAPENILEVTARAITYYLDVSNECTRRVTQVDGAVKAICNRLVMAEMSNRTSKDLAEQCVKLLEHICQREASVVYEAGGLQSMLHLVCQHDSVIHKDTMHSAMSVITRLCSKVELQDANLLKCSSNLGILLSHDDPKISECALRCFAVLTDRFIRKSLDPVELALPSNLVEHLLKSLVPSCSINIDEKSEVGSCGKKTMSTVKNRSPAFISIVLSLLSNLCRGSSAVTNQVICSPKLIFAIRTVLNSKDERCVMDGLRLADLLVVLLCEGRVLLPKIATTHVATSPSPVSSSNLDKTHRHLIDAIRQRDTDALIDAVENGSVDSNFIDDVGQTLLNWCAAFGTPDMVMYLCDKGADPNKGQRSSSLHYAACFGRPEIIKILLQYGGNPDLHDEEGRTALDKARERNDEGHQQVVQILESPGTYVTMNNGRRKTDQNNEHNQSDEKDAICSEVSSSDDSTQDDKKASQVREILQQLVAIACTVFQNSLVNSVRRSTLSLVRKCIDHLSSEGIFELINGSVNPYQVGRQSECHDFVENLMSVLVTVFNNEDNVEGKEQALLIMKSLLEKDTAFWLDQLIRLGVYEKVEKFSNSGEEAEPLAASNESIETTEKFLLPPESIIPEDSIVKPEQSEIIASSLFFDGSDNKSENRSISSTPSIASLSIKLDAESGCNTSANRAQDSSSERYQLLNIPVESDETANGEATTTPSPTVELEDRKRSSPSRPASNNNSTSGSGRLSSQFASVRADLVEAATAVAQALGVQIVDDSSGTSLLSSSINSVGELASDGGNLLSRGGLTTKKNAVEDVWKLAGGVFYKWNDWRLMRYKDSLFLWCDAVAIEFSDGSNGWLRFLMDGKLTTMYSNGNPQVGGDDSESRSEFVAKFLKAKNCIPTGTQTRTIFTTPRASRKIDSGNWQIGCVESGQLIITNQEGGEQRMVVKEDLPGFVFETTTNAQCFSAESTLGLDFVTGWAARGGGRRLRFRAEAQRQKLHELAKELWDNYLKEAKTKPRDALVQLQKNASTIAFLTEKIHRLLLNSEENSKFLNTSSTLEDDLSNLTKSLQNVCDVLSNERLLSTFEISVSNVVSALLKLLKYAFEEKCEVLAKCFLEAFSNVRDLSVLVRKMVLVLELAEKFSQQLYDAPGGSPFGLQLLTRRFKFRMELADPDHERQKTFHNYSNRTMKSEPLATVGALRQHLLGLVMKRWYDYPRELLAFVKQLKEMKERNEKLELTYESDFDTNGLIWFLGTNGRTNSEWTNPALIRVLSVCYADGARLLYGQPEDLLSRDVMPLNCQTADMPDANFTMDLGVWLFPTAYTLRQAQNYEKSSLRNWFLQASKDNFVWDVIMVHSNDTSLNEAGSTATWHIETEDTKKGPYRYFRIAQNGKNSASSYSISLSGFEIYGQIVDVVDTELKNLDVQPSNSLSKMASKSTPISSLTLGSKKQKQKPTGATSTASSTSGSFEGSNNVKGITSYSPPPTTSSIRHTRKQQKLQKMGSGGGTSGSADNDRPTARTTSSPASNSTTGFEFKLSDIGANFDSELFKQLTGSGANKLRMLRYHRNGRSHQHSLSSSNNIQAHGIIEPTGESQINVENEDKDRLPPTPPSSTPMLKIGTRVVPGQDWPWSNQNHNLVGTIVGVGKTAGGWVDVQWDDGTSNAYRFGHSGKYDVEPLDESNSKAATILSSYQRGKILRMKSGLPPSSKQFQPIGSEKKATAANKHSVDKTGGRLSLEARRTSNLDAIEDEEQILERQSSAEYQQNQKTISTVATTLLGSSNTTTSISQKSMSATNLFDDRQRLGHQQHSVASTNQAASAESLQHHTPSLENLLARSRIYADRIPEVVGDEQQSPNGTPEPRAYGSEEACQKSETNLPTMTGSASVAASTFAGGSQPVLSQSRRICFNSDFSEERFGSSINTVVSEGVDDKLAMKLSANVSGNSEKDGHTSASVNVLEGSSSEKHNQDEEESASKSVSEPQLAFSQPSSSSSPIQYVDAEPPPPTLNGDLATVEVAVSSSDEGYQHEHHQIEAHSADGGDGSDVSSTLLLATPPPMSSATMSNLSGNVSGSIRLKLGNYAEVLRGMMQQVIDSSGIIDNAASAFGDDELGSDIFDDELLGQSFIEDNCDVASLVDGFNQHFSIDSLSSAAAILRRQLSSNNGGGNHTAMGFNEVPSASSGDASALSTSDDGARRKFSVTRRATNNSESSVTATTTAAADERLTWRQMFMCSAEDERMMAPLPPPTQRVHHHTYPHDESASHQHTSSLRVTSADSATCCAALRREHNSNRRDNIGLTRVWDDEYVLRRQFGALIPAFDPRPGRTNVNQTQEVELADETSSLTYNRRGSLLKHVFTGKSDGRSIDYGSSQIRLFLKGPNLGGVEDEVIEMQDDNASVFYYIQKLASLSTWNSGGGGKSEKNRRIWEPVYIVVYEALCGGEENVRIPSLACAGKLLDRTALKENANDFAGLVNEALNVIKLLNSISSRYQIDLADGVFESTKITQKLTQCLTDPLIISASALPVWCNHLIYNYPCLFSTETRSMHLRATAFGTSRAIAWLQSRRDQLLEQNRSSGGSTSGSNLAGSRREDHYPEFRVGRIKHERIKVHRDDDLLLENAMRVLKFHAMRKAVLEIEYYAEEGTGLGPTLEFYALLSAEFQRKSLKMWLCDDADEQQSLLEADSLDLGEGEKPPGYYIRRNNGLFPAFMPHLTDECTKVTSYFKVFGIFLAKVIQDSRLVDIPLSLSFLKLILSPKVSSDEPSSLEDVLTVDDLAQIHFPKATFIRVLQRFVVERRLVLNSETLSESEKAVALAALKLKLADGTECRVEDLTLSFVLNPPSTIFDYNEIELMENGAEVTVTSENVENYVEKCLSVYLNTGIRQQVLAFREGFDSVFPLKSLCSFTPEELQTLISGDRSPQWSRDDLLKYTEPKLGYARDSIGFLHLVDVLVQMTAAERKAFLQFTTGCSSLPPGGLANLHPRLTVVRKVGAGDGSYPSVNTCVHYLKLPEYSSAAILRERLLAATFEKGFHLN